MANNFNGAYVRRQELLCTEAEMEANADKVLYENEVIYVRMNDGTVRQKIGDGVTGVLALPYSKVIDPTIAQDLGDGKNIVISQAGTTRAIKSEEARATARENEIEALFVLPTQNAVDKWLDEHPEATTTVQDGSLTEEKFTDELKLKAVKDYITPQMYGAKGNGSADDTEAFYLALNATDNLYLPEGTYLIDFKYIDLTGKTIRGASASKTTVMQINSNIPFAQIGLGTEISNLTIHMKQNTETTSCLLFGDMNGTRVSYTNHRIENVKFSCDLHTVVLHYALYGFGYVGGVVKNIEINTCKIGIWVDMTGKGWLTVHKVSNINIYHAYTAGIKITDADNSGQHTQSQYDNVSIMNSIDGSIGFDIGNCGVMFLNPACFIENSEGSTYSIKIDKGLGIKQSKYPFNIPLFLGGMLEGLLVDKDYLNLAKFVNCLFLPYRNLTDSVTTYFSLNSTVRPITKNIIEEYENNTNIFSKVNATVAYGVDEFGTYVEFSRTDETQRAVIYFNIGSNATLDSEVLDYPVSTFYTVTSVNFPAGYLEQVYDTGLGNLYTFPTISNPIDVPVADKTFLCGRTLIDDWTESEEYKVHHMQLNLQADAPAGSKVRIYKFCVNYGITPPAEHL